MVRVVKSAEERREEILGVARALFMRRGYDGTSVRDVIDAIGISKGAFYHHFDSKADLLAALTDALASELTEQLSGLVDEPLGALAKLDAYFTMIEGFKAYRVGQLVDLARAIYAPGNLALRTTLHEQHVSRAAPILARVIAQGVDEGVFTSEDPELTARMTLRMAAHLKADLMGPVVSGGPLVAESLLASVEAFARHLERMLGAPEGSLTVADRGFASALAAASSGARR
jgi:AcrR family transcriptional regulator